MITDGAGRGLSVLVTPGQAGDGPMLPDVLVGVVVPRLDGRAPRTTPDELLVDKAYSSASNRKLLRRRGVRTFDRAIYKRRNVVERAFNKAKQLPVRA